MTKTIAQTYTIVNQNVKLLSYAFLAGCLIMACVYVSSLFQVISNTVGVQHIESKMAVLSSNVDQLDSQYLNISGNLGPDTLQKYGLELGKVSFYISKAQFDKIGFASNNHVALRNER